MEQDICLKEASPNLQTMRLVVLAYEMQRSGDILRRCQSPLCKRVGASRSTSKGTCPLTPHTSGHHPSTCFRDLTLLRKPLSTLFLFSLSLSYSQVPRSTEPFPASVQPVRALAVPGRKVFAARLEQSAQNYWPAGSCCHNLPSRDEAAQFAAPKDRP